MNPEELKKYYDDNLISAAKSINAELVKCEDGSFLLV
jgi:hypothetical protein